MNSVAFHASSTYRKARYTTPSVSASLLTPQANVWVRVIGPEKKAEANKNFFFFGGGSVTSGKKHDIIFKLQFAHITNSHICRIWIFYLPKSVSQEIISPLYCALWSTGWDTCPTPVLSQTICWLVSWCFELSTTRDYIRAENKPSINLFVNLHTSHLSPTIIFLQHW